jgi:hypothetical protein
VCFAASSKALPLGELSAKQTERARTLTRTHRHSDSIALTKEAPVAVQRIRHAGLALSVIASDDTSPKGRGFSISQHVSFSFEADNFILPLSLPKFKNF